MPNVSPYPMLQELFHCVFIPPLEKNIYIFFLQLMVSNLEKYLTERFCGNSTLWIGQNFCICKRFIYCYKCRNSSVCLCACLIICLAVYIWLYVCSQTHNECIYWKLKVKYICLSFISKYLQKVLRAFI